MSRRLLIVLFFIIVLVLAGLFFFRSGFQEGRISFEIEAPDTIRAGEEIEYRVRLENKNETDIANARISFFFPEGSVPLDEKGNAMTSLTKIIEIGALEGGGTKEYFLKAILTGEKGGIKRAKASFSYSPSDIKSVFKKDAEAATTISSLSVSLDLSAPPAVLSGQRLQLALDLRNETESDFEDMQVLFFYPDGFVFRTASPAPSQGNNVFKVDSLKAGEGKRMTIEGDISGFEKEGKRFNAVLRKKIGDRFVDFQKTQTILTVSSPLLTLGISVNGEGEKELVAKTGDRLRYEVEFSNNSESNFSALELAVKLEGQMFDFATLRSGGFFDQNSQTILWNAAAEPLLSSLAPGRSGKIFFEVELKDDFPNIFGAKNFFLKVSPVLKTSSVPPDFGVDEISASASLITKISSKTDFTSEGFYNDPVFANSGPVPPKAGQKTTYTVQWRIVNKGNDLIKVLIVSALPPGVIFENRSKTTPQPAGILEYNSATGRLSWSMTTVPAGSGTVSGVFEAIFQISITPGVNQAGQAVDLIKEITFEAVDNFTKEDIMLTRPKISTSTISDAPGTVQP